MLMRPDQPTRLRVLLAQPGFFALLAIGGIANSVRWLEILASGLFAYAVTESGLAVAIVIAARSLPMLLFGAVFGALSEANDRKRILLLATIAWTASSATVAVLALMGALEVYQLTICNFISGTVWASEMSTRRRMIGECVGAHGVGQAIAVDSIINACTRLVGPIAGGLAFQYAGMAGTYVAAVCGLLVCILLTAVLHHRQEAFAFAPRQFHLTVVDGLRFARRNAVVAVVLWVSVIMNTFAFSYIGQIAPIGQGQFGVSATLVGVLAAAEPFGAMLAGMIIARGSFSMRPDRMLFGGSALFFLTLIAMCLSPSYWLGLAAMVAGGAGTAGFSNMQATLILTRVPSEMRSRMMGLITACFGTAPIGMLIAGLLSGPFGPAGAVLITGIVGFGLLGAVTLWFAPRLPDMRT